MPHKAENVHKELKVVILAAGKETSNSDIRSILLQNLGSQKVIDYVIQNGRQLVSPDNIYIVVGRGSAEMQAHLGGEFHYVCQEQQLGTGHAVLQLKPLFADFHGDLLIIYGDTPLFRPDSIRGLLNRHRLRQAKLTLLSAVVDRSNPYGRIIRDAKGQIVDIIEAADASDSIRSIREINIGAYVVSADIIFPALEKLPLSYELGEIRLTDCVHQIVHSGLLVESHQIFDQDEVQGINSPDDLANAEFILQKRLFRPHRPESENQITFGTGGWRAIIGEGFTMHNVRRLSQALANKIIFNGQDKLGVLIGYDRRFLSDRAAETSAEVFAGNNIPVTLLSEDAPTPLVTYATSCLNSAYGLVFTASHNPPEWNGLKVFRGDGSLLLDDETRAITNEVSNLTADQVIKLDLDLAVEAGIVKLRDMTNEYVDAVEKIIDMDAIRKANLRVIVDPMYGVGQLTLGILLTEARCRVTFIHERRNPLFGGRSPAPDLESLRMLINDLQEGHYDLGLATDGDADRIAIIDEKGCYISTNDLLLLIYWYLHEVRGWRGGVIRNLATTHMLDRMAAKFNEKCYEVPVGFKHIAAGMVKYAALMGGESSGGLTVRGHILGKDGIFACALVVEMLARTGKRISEMQEQAWKVSGRLYSLEENIPATPEMRIVIPRRLEETPITMIAGYPVLDITNYDGTKFLLEKDNWTLLRFSGTEPILRLMAESDSSDKARELIGWLKQFCKTVKLK